MSLPYKVSQKIIISGDFIEHYEYEKPYWVGWPTERRFGNNFKRSKTLSEQESLREDNVRRTRIKIRRLVNTNQDLVKFMTLTYNRSVPDLTTSNLIFRKFIKRLKRLYPDFKYLCVPEFQKDVDFMGNVKLGGGSVHYHLLCNLPFIEKKELEGIWGNGFAFIRKVDSIDNLGAYVCKYLGKANFDKRYFKKNKFFYSQNLLRPLVVDNLEQIISIIQNLPINTLNFCQKVFSAEFLTKFLGMIKYNQYKLARFIKVAG